MRQRKERAESAKNEINFLARGGRKRVKIGKTRAVWLRKHHQEKWFFILSGGDDGISRFSFLFVENVFVIYTPPGAAFIGSLQAREHRTL